jgi:UDP-glucose 4-epimerase
MSKLKDARILVTGGTGFIGSHLVERLRAEGARVDTLSKETGDIRDPNLRIDKYTIIYHLAGISNPRECEVKPEHAWDVNVNGTFNLLTKLRRDQRFIFASSAHVYDTTEHPHSEDECLNPMDFYGLTKKICEELISHFKKEKGYRVTVLRFFNIYGPGQEQGFFIPDLIHKYTTGGRVTVYNPEAIRDFLYIDDAVRALVASAEKEGTFNIAYGKPVKIGEAYSIVREKLGLRQVKEEVIRGEKKKLVGDISKALKELNWRPRVSLNEGIAKTLDYYLTLKKNVSKN